MQTTLTPKLQAVVNSLTDTEKDCLYRHLWQDYVKEDIIAHAENMGVKLTDDEIQTATEKYVYEGKYDCNLNYWNNIENLINEVRTA